jgi:hypothetical protein
MLREHLFASAEALPALSSSAAKSLRSQMKDSLSGFDFKGYRRHRRASRKGGTALDGATLQPTSCRPSLIHRSCRRTGSATHPCRWNRRGRTLGPSGPLHSSARSGDRRSHSRMCVPNAPRWNDDDPCGSGGWNPYRHESPRDRASNHASPACWGCRCRRTGHSTVQAPAWRPALRPYKPPSIDLLGPSSFPSCVARFILVRSKTWYGLPQPAITCSCVGQDFFGSCRGTVRWV